MTGTERVPFAADRGKILVIAAAGLLTGLSQSLAVPLLPRFPALLDASPVDTGWVLTALLLAAIVTTPIFGRLADLYGKRRIAIIQLSCMLVGSVVIVVEQGLAWVLAGRIAQGFGFTLIPVALGLLRDAVHPANLTRGITLFSAAAGISGSIGLPVSALVADHADWHAIFAGLTIATGLTIAGFALMLPPGPRAGRAAFDVPGAILLAVTLGAGFLALSRFPVLGWSPILAGLVVTTGVALALFIVVELRVRHPLVNLRVLRSPLLALTMVTAFGAGFGSFVGFGSLPQLMQAPAASEVGLGMTILESALVLAIFGTVMLVLAPVVRRAMDRFGSEAALAVGCAASLSSTVIALCFLDGVPQVVLVLVLSGIAAGFSMSALPAIVMRAVPIDETAAANGLMTVLQSTGSTVAAALGGAIIGAASVVVDGVLAPTRAAYVELYLVGTVAAGIALVVAVLVGAAARPRPTAEPAPAGG